MIEYFQSDGHGLTAQILNCYRAMRSLSFALLLSITCIHLAYGQEEGQFEFANFIMVNGDYAYAAELFSEIIENETYSPLSGAYYKRAYCHFHLQDYSKAESDIKAIFAFYYDDAYSNDSLRCWTMSSSYWLYARIYSIRENDQESLQLYHRAVEYGRNCLARPSLSRLLSTVGYKQILLNDYQGALRSLEEAISLDSTNSYAYSNRGLLFINSSEFDKARIDIDKAILYGRTNPYAYKHSAMIYIALEQYDLACVELNKAERLGYSSFLGGRLADSNHVEQLKIQYCSK